MGQSGRFYDDLEGAFGKGNVTSGYRTQAEQDALIAQGATRTEHSSHTYRDGYDISMRAASTPQQVVALAKSRGYGVGHLIQEGGGHNDGTGPHWHGEFFKLGNGPQTPNGIPVNSSQPGNGVGTPASFLDGLAPTLAPESKASGAVSEGTQTAFGADGELQKRADNVETVLEQQKGAVDILTQVTDAAQAVQLASMADQVNETRAVSNEIVEGNKELTRKVTPVFAARGRIADQLDKLNTMNPLERGLRGIFDLNYDRNHLEQQLAHYDTTLEARAHDYDYLQKLHTSALTEIGRRYTMDNAIPALLVEGAKEDLGVIGIGIQQAAGMLGNLGDRVKGETQLISARAIAKEDMMGQLDSPTVLDLANKAKSANGVVAFNGIQFSYHELRERLEKDDEQNLIIEGHKMAIAAGRMDMAEKYATNLARSLTRPQVEAAMAKGGVHNGIQLPQDVLQNAYQNFMQTASIQANAMATNLPSSVALQTASAELTRISAIQKRTRGMFGGSGVPEIANNLNAGTQMVRDLIKATNEGAPPEIITAMTQRIAANSAAAEKNLDTSLLRQTGGDRDSAGYLKSFIMGAPLDSAASVQAVTHFAIRGARPDGIPMTPETQGVFKEAERLVRDLRVKNPKISAESLQQQVASQLTDYASRTVGSARFERLTQSLPQMAAREGHPFGKISPQDWATVRAHAEADAFNGLAQQLGMSVDVVRRMRTNGKPLSTSPADVEAFKRFQQGVGTFNAMEQTALIQGIDELPQVKPGTRNSSVMLDFYASPALHKQAGQYGQALGSESFGDYLINPITGGATETFLSQQGEGLRIAQAEQTQSDRQSARAMGTAYGNNPMLRVQTILASIPGVNKDGMTKLTPHIATFMQTHASDFAGRSDTQRMDPRNPGGQVTDTSRMMREESLVLNYLQTTKFDDPSLENWRKVAVRGWKDSATQSQGVMSVFLDLLNPFN